MPESSGEKTENATSHKRAEERKKGNVMQSKDVVTAIFILAIFNLLRIYVKVIYQIVIKEISYWMSIAGNAMGDNGKTIDSMPVYAKLSLEIGKNLLVAAGPIIVSAMLISVLGSGVQTKFIKSTESIKFKLDKLNPINGIKKLFSLNSLFELAKSILKIVVLSFIVYSEVKKRIPDIIRLIDVDIVNSLIYMADSVYAVAMKICIVFIAIAALDYLYQKWKWEKDMKMTKQEVKEEYKTLEGDPKIKSKRRQKQMEMAMARMMQAVPEADVIIRNPTHFAVAVKYNAQNDSAPIVVAKGADYLAKRIIKIAEENNIPLVENKPLARSLYDSVKLDHEIPSSLYSAVAEVLIFVYKLKNKTPY